jgi:hypothetical protein
VFEELNTNMRPRKGIWVLMIGWALEMKKGI